MRLAVLLLANNHYLSENDRNPPPQYKNVVVLEYLEISW